MTKTRTAASSTALDANRAAELAAHTARLNGATEAEAHAAYLSAYATGCGTVTVDADSTEKVRGGARRGVFARTGGFFIRGLAAFATVAAVAAFSSTAAQGQTPTVTRDSGVWASPTLTVYVADEAAWAGTDVPAALAQWAPVMRMVVTDNPDADITLDTAPLAKQYGANTKRSTVGGVIRSCRIDLSQRLGGHEWGHVLAHELGHCLGLHDSTLADTHEMTVMFWMSGVGNYSAERVTPADLDAVRALYR